MTDAELLKKMIDCYSCVDVGKSYTPVTFNNLRSKVAYFEKNLPTLSYVLTQALNYIFSNGLTAPTQKEKEILKNFLYRENMSKETNYMAFRSALGHCMLNGEAGLRWYKDNIYLYKSGKFATITSMVDGIKVILGYLVKTNADTISDVSLKSPEELGKILKDKNYIFLGHEDFCQIRTDTSKLHGQCPFENDTLRLELLCEVYSRLLFDLKFDGPGRLIIRPEVDYNEGRSASEILSQNKDVIEREKKAFLKEIERITNDLKNSKSDSVLYLSRGFSDKITHLPRVTKSTEFLTWLMKEEGVIVAEKLGIRPTILGLDEIAGNVSQEKIIDDTMLNSIVPIRELYSNQFSSFISSHLGISKVYFDKYELQQSSKDYDIRHKYAETIRNLSNSVSNLQKGDGNEVAVATLTNTISNLSQIMNESLFIDDNDILKEM